MRPSAAVRLAACPIFLLSLAAGTLFAQSPAEDPNQAEIGITVSGVAPRQIPLVIPPVQVKPRAGSEATRAAKLIREIIASDLTYSGLFNVLPPSLYANVTIASGRVPLREFSAIGAVGVVTASVGTREDDELIVEGLLFDSKTEALITGKRYRGAARLARDIAHRISNAVTIAYTGKAGVYLSRVVFVGKIGQAKEIFVMDYDGSDLKQITNNKTLNISPTWSPDGRRLAFVSYRMGSPRLYIYDGKDGRLTDGSPEGSELCIAPDWSPDGRYIAFSSSSKGNSEIFIMDVSTQRSRRISFSRGTDTSPDWSPSGREIVFTSDRTGRPQLYLMDAEGANVRKLTDTGDFSDSGAWSPSGDKIAYASRIRGRFEILIMDVASREVHVLTQNSRNNESPRWSPDGRHIIFSSNRTGTYQVYTMDVDGNRQEPISTEFEATMPDWSR
ncbi:MAG: Tol-Pal system beta propeller repeat protein TolB [Acidobacteriota bacterium]